MTRLRVPSRVIQDRLEMRYRVSSLSLMPNRTGTVAKLRPAKNCYILVCISNVKLLNAWMTRNISYEQNICHISWNLCQNPFVDFTNLHVFFNLNFFLYLLHRSVIPLSYYHIECTFTQQLLFVVDIMYNVAKSFNWFFVLQFAYAWK